MRFAVLAVLALTACGSHDATGPSGPVGHAYPDVAGAYTVVATFDNIATAQIGGSIVLVQASRDAPGLTGTFNLTGTVNGAVFVLAGPVSAGTVTPSGTVTFAYRDVSGSWDFSGTLSGGTITGRHTLTGDATYSGSWSARR